MKRCIVMLAAIALCLSCNGEKFAEGRQMFRELLTLRDLLAKEFHEKVVDVTITNGDRVTVKFINSPLKAASAAEKQQRADAVAAFVVKTYPRPVSSVNTQFVSKAGAGGVSLAMSDSYAGRLPKQNGSEPAATASSRN